MFEEIIRPDDIVEEPPLLGGAQVDNEVGGLADRFSCLIAPASARLAGKTLFFLARLWIEGD